MLGCLHRAHAVVLLAAALLVAPIVWFAMRQIAIVLEKQGPDAAVAPLAESLIAARAWAPLSVLPAIAVAVAMLRVRRGLLVWMVIGVAALLVPVALVLWCFISVLAPLYQVQPL